MENQKLTPKILLKEGLDISYRKVFNGEFPRLRKKIRRALIGGIVTVILLCLFIVSKARPEIIIISTIFMVTFFGFFCYRMYNKTFLINSPLEQSDIEFLLDKENNKLSSLITDCSLGIDRLEEWIKEERKKLEKEKDVDSLKYRIILDDIDEYENSLNKENEQIEMLKKEKQELEKEIKFFK